MTNKSVMTFISVNKISVCLSGPQPDNIPDVMLVLLMVPPLCILDPKKSHHPVKAFLDYS